MRIDEDVTYKAILGYIYERGRGYPDEIASTFKFTRQAADYRLKKLVLNGYLEKLLDKDGRVYYLLTSKGYRLLGVKPKVSRREIYKVIKYIPLLPIALGLIGMGKYVAEADFMRGLVSLGLWSIVGLIVYILMIKIFQ